MIPEYWALVRPSFHMFYIVQLLENACRISKTSLEVESFQFKKKTIIPFRDIVLCFGGAPHDMVIFGVEKKKYATLLSIDIRKEYGELSLIKANNFKILEGHSMIFIRWKRHLEGNSMYPLKRVIKRVVDRGWVKQFPCSVFFF